MYNYITREFANVWPEPLDWREYPLPSQYDADSQRMAWYGCAPQIARDGVFWVCI
jgi:hypothetical protein